MKNRSEKYFCLAPGILTAFCLALLLAGSCRSNAERELIPEKKFAQILYEIHLADGLISLPDIHDRYYQRDSVVNYTDIIESHGYTKEEMDKTLKYYFQEKPKRLIKIYDHAIGKLTEMESVLAKELDEIPTLQGGLWKGTQVYYLTGRSDTAKLYFDHIFYTPGEYKLEFTVTVHPSDQSLNPCLAYYTCRADSLTTGKRNFFRGIEYIKDGQPHTYTYLLRIPNNLPIILKGWLFDHENNSEEIWKYAKIDNISFALSSIVQ
jgi:hypothetical protein